MRCECDWTFHRGRACGNEAADHGAVRTSPELCMVCLYVCCREADDVTDDVEAVNNETLNEVSQPNDDPLPLT